MIENKDKSDTQQEGGAPPKECSFCGRQIDYTRVLVKGAKSAICDICVVNASQVVKLAIANNRTTLKDGIPTPREIYDELSAYVIGQDEAKKRIAVAVYNHYKRITSETLGEDVELEKSNILLIGPTGTGKTLLAQTLARFLKVPFAIADATTLTEAGYVGEDVENVLVRLYHSANNDVSQAEIGIVYIDELDKIARKDTSTSITRDVSGEGVQQALLKILEGAETHIPPEGGRKHPEQRLVKINTKNILFICGGAFDGVDLITQNRLGKAGMGFNAVVRSKQKMGYFDLLRKVEPDDLRKFGLIPELIGRLPVITPLDRLSREALMSILTEPRNALVKQYCKLIELEGVELSLKNGALEAIVDKAMELDTGARALRNVIETVMNDLMFELPELEGVKRVVINENVVLKKHKPTFIKHKPKRKSA